jgi:hypothetical protein
LITLSPHPFGSTSKDSTFIGSFIHTLGCFIVLLMNIFLGSITIVDNILYHVGHSYVLGTIGIVYCIIFRVWNYVASFANCSIPLLHFLLHFVA